MEREGGGNEGRKEEGGREEAPMGSLLNFVIWPLEFFSVSHTSRPGSLESP